MILSNWLEDRTTCQRLLVSVVGSLSLFKYFLRQIRNYIFSGYIIRKVQEWANMLWFTFVTQIWNLWLQTNSKKKVMKTTSPLVSRAVRPWWQDVLVRLSLLLNKLSVLYPMQSKGWFWLLPAKKLYNIKFTIVNRWVAF
jgi:hypothetical protein